MKIAKTILFLLISLNAFSQWENLNTGINDNLNGVVFFQQNGLVSGENGLYYTTNGGVGSSSWTELHIPSNSISPIFEDTKFTHCYAVKTNTTNTGIVYACGQTVSDSKAVLFKIDIPSMTCELIYQGLSNTKLNKIDCVNNDDRAYAVGDNGKMLNFTSTGSMIEVTTNTTENLVSIANSSSGRTAYGSSNKVWTAWVFGAGLSDFGGVQNSSIEVKDICDGGTVAYIAGGNKFNYVYFNNSGINGAITNFSIPLDANAIINTYYAMIGTSHGIYKYINNCLEWQPSSLSHHINEFWLQTGNTYTYACGDNGVLLRTSTNGGASKPYVVMNANGTCVNGTVQFSAIMGSGNSAKWYINNQLSSTSLTGFNYTFNSIGQYLIRLEVTNSFNETTIVSQNIDIVNIPTINKPISISDNILCKAETIQITIDNSEPYVKYVLRKDGLPNSNFGESPHGNGGTIILNSGLIDLTGDYYIDAVSTLANCKRRFDANFLITVEETKADFHSGYINTYVNELVSYHNQSFDAQNFSWQFLSTSGTQNSNSINPQNSYSTPGQVSVNLDAWSNNDCHDIITENGPFILNPITNTSDCMLLMNNGSSGTSDSNYGIEDISQINTVSDGGILTCGSYTNIIFDSEQGVTLSLPNKQGGYLLKHDQNGVLKWAVYSVNQYTLSTNDSGFSSCVEDLEGNIYLSGHMENGIFQDNSGKVINLTSSFLKDFIIKLNSKGELIWRIQTQSMKFFKLSIDKLNNLVAYVQFPYYPTVGIYFNNNFVQNVDFNYPYGWAGVYDQDDVRGLLKITSSGSILWNTRFISDETRGYLNHVIGFDDLNNIYVSSPSPSGVDFYSANTNSNVKSIPGNGTYSGKFAIAKYSSDGVCLWAIRSRTMGTAVGTSDGTSLGGHFVDGAGNIFIAGKNGCTPTSSNFTHVFENADGSSTQTNKGTYFLAKVNTNGICQWIRSTTNNVLAGAGLLTKDTDELFVLGNITSGNSNPIHSAEFEGGVNNNYSLTMNRNNFFVAAYDFDGNLKKMFLNSNFNNLTSTSTNGIRNFINDQNGNFYFSRNIRLTQTYNEFGYIIPVTIETDGVVSKFKENCGVMMYDVTLSNETNNLSNSNLILYPNPTTEDFGVDLNGFYKEIIMEVYDIYGKVVKKEKYLNQEKINSKLNCSSGIYLLKLNCDGTIHWLKLIKE
jgi:hypothetical protein